MGPENSNSPQPFASSDQPVDSGQKTSQETSSQPSNDQSGNGQSGNGQSGPDSLSSDAPLDSSLLSMMKSLTPNAPATSGDSAPQYPSLEAAVGIEPQVAPTLTNLLAAKPQAPLNLGLLGNPGMAIAHPADSQTSPPSPTLVEEQGSLAGEAIAVELPQSSPESSQESSPESSPTPAANLAQHGGAEQTEQDASWEAIAQASPPPTPSEPSTSAITAPAREVTPQPSQDETSTSQENTVTVAPSPETAIAATGAIAEADVTAAGEAIAEAPAELAPTQTQPADREAQAGADEAKADEAQADEAKADEAKADEVQSENEDFDQIKEGAAEGDRAQQVLIKREETHIAIIFPKEETNANPDIALDFIDSQLWQDLQQRLSGGIAFASNTPVHLYSQNCLLDTRQLQELDEALGRFNLKLARIITSRRQTAVAAAMSGYSADQTNSLPELLTKEIHSPQRIGLAEPLYLQKNIRSGTEIRHPGSVVIMGDLNPGSSVIADGDILVWGRLRGVAHAGAAGNQGSIVMALKLEAPQLRIAGAVARVDAQGKGNPTPEIAYINDKAIRITSAYGFSRSELSELGS